MRRLQREIKQTKAFPSPEEEAYLNLLRTADALSRGLAELLRTAKLTPTQYNVLRILRGAGPAGLACRDVGDRMLTRDPDVTRLLDRLERSRLVRRFREGRDRRVITTRITPAGLRVLRGLDAPVTAAHKQQLAHLGARKLGALIDLLELARGKEG